jgi:hypothetical protein
MAQTKQTIKRSDGHVQRYTVGSNIVVPTPEAGTPSPHATVATSSPAEFAPETAPTDYSDLVDIPQSFSDSDASVDETGRSHLYRYSIKLDRRTGVVTNHYTYVPHDDGTWTQAEQGGLVTGWAFSNPLTGEGKSDILANVASDLGKLVAGFTEVWNGSNFVAEDSDIDGESMDDVRERIETAFDNGRNDDWELDLRLGDEEADYEYTGGLQRDLAKELSTPDFIVSLIDDSGTEYRQVTIVNSAGDDLLNGQVWDVQAFDEHTEGIEEAVAEAKDLVKAAKKAAKKDRKVSKWTERSGLSGDDRRLLIEMKKWRESEEEEPLYRRKMLAIGVPRFGKEWWLIPTKL